MSMKLSNEFEQTRQNFLNAVTNGAPQEEQAKLYNEMIESMTSEMMSQARSAAHEEVSAMSLLKLVNFSTLLKKQLL